MTSEDNKVAIAIMASGNGSNAENLIRFAADRSRSIGISIGVACVVCDKENAGVIERAKRLGVKTHIVSKHKGESKKVHEQRMIALLRPYRIDWICLAGYMRILTPHFLKAFHNTEHDVSGVINIHPSLLPKFPGLNAYEQAFSAGEREGGATVHFVDAGIDTGEHILQMSFTAEPDYTLDTFKKKGLELEHRLYPMALLQLIDRFGKNSSSQGK